MPTVFDVAHAKQRINEIEVLQSAPDFWHNREQAEHIQRELAELTTDVLLISELTTRLVENKELATLAATEGDSETLAAITTELEILETTLAEQERTLRYDGPHDKSDAIISIQAGAGGTDAQDWAQMLERMYLRFAEGRYWPTTMVNRSAGEEAGIKHVTFTVKGKYAYGTLRGEHGIHRLVRQSPFNADALRQTSFARVEITPRLPPQETPTIDTDDLQIDTFRASGAGGQHVNKTSSAIRIRHVPTGIVVECQNERSQAQNKAYALSILQSKLQLLMEEQRADEITQLRGTVKQAAWGNQIRSYVVHPYQLIKDHRSNIEVRDVMKVLDGGLEPFLDL